MKASFDSRDSSSATRSSRAKSKVRLVPHDKIVEKKAMLSRKNALEVVSDSDFIFKVHVENEMQKQE